MNNKTEKTSRRIGITEPEEGGKEEKEEQNCGGSKEASIRERQFEKRRIPAPRFEKISWKDFSLLVVRSCFFVARWVGWLVGRLVRRFLCRCSCCLHVWLFGLACFADLPFCLSGAVCVRVCFVSLCSTIALVETTLTVLCPNLFGIFLI